MRISGRAGERKGGQAAALKQPTHLSQTSPRPAPRQSQAGRTREHPPTPRLPKPARNRPAPPPTPTADAHPRMIRAEGHPHGYV